MSELSTNSGDWKAAIRDVKTSEGYSSTLSEDILTLGSKLIAAIYPEIDLSNVISKPGDEEKASIDVGTTKKAKEKISVIDAAEDWRKRQRGSVVVRLAGHGLPGFFTTGTLATILMYTKGRVPELVNSAFLKKEELSVFLTNFLSIRSAVAHNLALSFSTLEQLQKLQEELYLRIGQK